MERRTALKWIGLGTATIAVGLIARPYAQSALFGEPAPGPNDSDPLGPDTLLLKTTSFDVAKPEGLVKFINPLVSANGGEVPLYLKPAKDARFAVYVGGLGDSDFVDAYFNRYIFAPTSGAGIEGKLEEVIKYGSLLALSQGFWDGRQEKAVVERFRKGFSATRIFFAENEAFILGRGRFPVLEKGKNGRLEVGREIQEADSTFLVRINNKELKDKPWMGTVGQVDLLTIPGIVHARLNALTAGSIKDSLKTAVWHREGASFAWDLSYGSNISHRARAAYANLTERGVNPFVTAHRIDDVNVPTAGAFAANPNKILLPTGAVVTISQLAQIEGGEWVSLVNVGNQTLASNMDPSVTRVARDLPGSYVWVSMNDLLPRVFPE